MRNSSIHLFTRSFNNSSVCLSSFSKHNKGQLFQNQLHPRSRGGGGGGARGAGGGGCRGDGGGGEQQTKAHEKHMTLFLFSFLLLLLFVCLSLLFLFTPTLHGCLKPTLARKTSLDVRAYPS